MSFQHDYKNLFHVPVGWPKPFVDIKSYRLTSSNVELGRVLFYDPILSADSSISCASCHSPYSAFAHTDHPLSHGINNQIGTRNAPALFNLAWKSDYMWDGAFPSLKVQAVFPITHPKEMGESMQNVLNKLQKSNTYKTLYKESFGDTTINSDRTLTALSSFMLTLISDQSKYDSVMKHQAHFTEQENNGYRIYQQHCSSCHREPLFTNDKFENNGLAVDSNLKDAGRVKVTLNKNDSLLFKVPSLRNIEYTYPYMHDGRFRNLTEVIKYYSTSPPVYLRSNNLQLPVPLSSNERVDLIAFLLTLSDKHFAFNPEYGYPKKIFERLAKDSK